MFLNLRSIFSLFNIGLHLIMFSIKNTLLCDNDSITFTMISIFDKNSTARS